MAPSGLISGYCVCSEISKPILNKNMQKIVKHLTLCFLVWICFCVLSFFRKRWILIHTKTLDIQTPAENLFDSHNIPKTPSLEAYGCLVNSCQRRTKHSKSLPFVAHCFVFVWTKVKSIMHQRQFRVYLSKRDGKTTVYYKYNSNEHCYYRSVTLSVRKISHDASMGLVYLTCFFLPYKSTIHVGFHMFLCE